MYIYIFVIYTYMTYICIIVQTIFLPIMAKKVLILISGSSFTHLQDPAHLKQNILAAPGHEL